MLSFGGDLKSTTPKRFYYWVDGDDSSCYLQPANEQCIWRAAAVSLLNSRLSVAYVGGDVVGKLAIRSSSVNVLLLRHLIAVPDMR
jgi:hypothetical protein